MIKNALLIAAGFLFLLIGAIGLFLPVWPTTPFVLLSAGCLAGSPRLRMKIMRIGFFREHIENYQNRQGLSNKTLAFSLAYLWGMLLISMLLILKPWMTLLLSAIGIAVTIHLLCMAKRKIKTEK